MFGKLFGRKPKTSAGAVELDELSDRPFTRALLLRAAKEVDESKRHLDDMMGRRSPALPALDTLDQRIASAASVIAFHVTHEASKEAGCKPFVYASGDKISVETQMVIAFGFVVIMSLLKPLEHEGYKLDFRETGISLTSNTLMLMKPEEIVAAHQAAAEIFKGLAQAMGEHPNVQEWMDNTTKLVSFYVEQFTTTVPKLKEMKIAPLLGAQLKTFLSSRE
ncbi:MAG TPA: hypothetical protein VFB13_17580 [Reyranella sp.]|jgi:hypothetical protein|nr:hypothetical protein [Reyranella sp.]